MSGTVVVIGINARVKVHGGCCWHYCHHHPINGACQDLLPGDAPSLLAAERIGSKSGAGVGSGGDTS